MKVEERKEAKENSKGGFSGTVSFLISILILCGIAYLLYSRFQAEKQETLLSQKSSQLQIKEYRCENVLYVIFHYNNTVIVVNHTADSMQLTKACIDNSGYHSERMDPTYKKLPLFQHKYPLDKSSLELTFLK